MRGPGIPLGNTGVDAMAAKKIAISLPPQTLKQIDQAARETGESRSGFIARICMLAAMAKSDREIRRKINELFADPEVRPQPRAGAVSARPEPWPKRTGR